MRLSSDTPFNADLCPAAVVGIAVAVGQHDSGMHTHTKGQLLFAYKGCMSITLADRKYVLPPTRLAWIPAGIPHRAKMHGTIEYRSIYIQPDYLSLPWRDIQMLSVNALLKEVLERVALWAEDIDLDTPANQNLLAVLVDELKAATVEPILLAFPKDRRLYSMSSQLDEAYCLPSLGELASKVGASDKTITRIFKKETGMSYQQWRLMRAIELLSEDLMVSDVSDRLAFASDSAFISFFRQHTGLTPGSYTHGCFELRD